LFFCFCFWFYFHFILKGFIAGPAIGIAIGLSFGVEHIKMAFQVTCLAASLIAAGAFVTGLFFLKDTAQAGPPSVAAAPAVWTVVKSLLRKRNFLLVLVITFLSQFEGTCLEAALPLLLVEEQKCEIWQVLAVFATMALAVPVIVGVLYPKMSEKIGQKRVMIFGMSVHIGESQRKLETCLFFLF
jgi:Na+/melibiose symporter-like transporter